MSVTGIAVFVFVGVYMVFGAYRGFCVSLFKSAGFFMSWIVAYILHPVLSMFLGKTGILTALINYTEGAAKISTASIQLTYQPVASMDAASLNTIVDTSGLVSPFSNMVKRNLVSHALADKGLYTVGEYFDYTVGYATLNILCFLFLFVVCRLIWHLIVNFSDATHPFPVLRHYDTALGALVGLLRGVFDCFAWFMLVPVALSVLGAPAITEYILSSPLSSFFYVSNFLLLLMRGTIW